MTPPTCHTCSRPITDPLQGCPHCLFQLAVGIGTVERAYASFTPPSLEDLSRLMPDFEFLELIGRGGMGAVYKVRQVRLDRIAALKVLPPERASDPNFVERFFREAQALAQLVHPGIVAVYDMGQHGQFLYILMEFVSGSSLRDLIRAKALTPAETLRLVADLCQAVHFAHQQGIVHRDIKPENVLVTPDRAVKLLDFGLVKLTQDSRLDRFTLTEINLRMGTPLYMAPEQFASGATIDHRADVYALGILLYEALVGEPPALDYTPPSRKVKTDSRVDRVVHRAIRESLAERYQSADDMRRDLERIAGTPRRRALSLAAIVVPILLAGAYVLSRTAPPSSQIDTAPPPGAPIDGLPIAVLPFTPEEARAHQERWADHLGLPVQWTNSIGMKFVLIPPGEYLRGVPPGDVEHDAPTPVEQGGEISGVHIFQSNLPQHRVRLTQPFYLCTTETTQGQFRRVTGSDVGYFRPNGPGAHLLTSQNPDNLPVQTLSWGMAVEFCDLLSQLEGFSDGYRLPTDAQFDFALRAGTSTRFWYGDQPDDDGQYEASYATSSSIPLEVASLAPNPFGLYDMAGNVCEFCSDWWTLDEYRNFADSCAIDPRGPADGAAGGYQRVVRGGSYDNPPDAHKSYRRVRSDPSLWVNTLGFRVAIPARSVADHLRNLRPVPTPPTSTSPSQASTG